MNNFELYTKKAIKERKDEIERRYIGYGRVFSGESVTKVAKQLNLKKFTNSAFKIFCRELNINVYNELSKMRLYRKSATKEMPKDFLKFNWDEQRETIIDYNENDFNYYRSLSDFSCIFVEPTMTDLIENKYRFFEESIETQQSYRIHLEWNTSFKTVKEIDKFRSLITQVHNSIYATSATRTPLLKQIDQYSTERQIFRYNGTLNNITMVVVKEW